MKIFSISIILFIVILILNIPTSIYCSPDCQQQQLSTSATSNNRKSIKTIKLLDYSNSISFQDGVGCTHPIYCTGPILNLIQMSQIFNDSKTFVDMPMKYSSPIIIQYFNTMITNTSSKGGPSKQDLINFVSQNFYPAGYEVEPVKPKDWVPNPTFLNDITNPQLYQFASAIHTKWLDLTRIFNNTGLCIDCFSSIPVSNPFVIAGSRFREFYYWDSYWIIRGLLVSGMTETAKGMLLNFANIITEFGFIPNGGRIYYLNRSQPPLYTQMVKIYFDATNDIQFLEEILPILDLEYQWWMKYRVAKVAKNDQLYTLNLYNVSNQSPRPESYFEDFTGASEFSNLNQRDFYYSSISSAAESGWDFSSRWTSLSDINLSTIQTINILPVDLNSMLYLNEKTLSNFYTILGDTNQAQYYKNQSLSRAIAIENIFWNENINQWIDFNLINSNLEENLNFYTSNLQPLFSDIQQDMSLSDELIDSILKSVSEPLTNYIGGVPTSTVSSGSQFQWDDINSWAPLQYFIIEMLMDVNTTLSTQIGTSLIDRWITTNYCGWKYTLETQGGMMFEKYNVTNVGVPGSGGEYVVQDGFGWTNGVALYLINKYHMFINLNSC
ncbi:hypothetical protein CYY_007322 [Polysphondylium violaceum]|uniref:Trehalase n=1 Tax=Polysphondylium violaceum TaxID=133409 RepID=A0A8J4PPV6_9MYCE|nr:hypothetical protein CYY_007322 [Polysphondylium violaceum]